VLCGVGLGSLFALCFPPSPLPLLVPFALLGLLALLRGMTPRQAAYIGLGFGVALSAIALRWLWGMFGAAAVSIWAIAGIFPAAACCLITWLRGRLPRVPFPLLAAVVWAGIEYFRSEPMALNFAWMGVGYALTDYPLPCRIATVVGSYGITFVVVGWCAFASMGGSATRMGLRLAPLALLFARLPAVPPAPTPATSVAVRLVQANSEDDDSLFRLSRGPAAAAPRLIVWPEYSYVSDPRRNPKLWKQLQTLPRESGSYFLFGAKDQFDPGDPDKFRNTAFLLDPQGDLIGQHVKNHTVHFIKDGTAGTDANVFPTTFGALGVGICFDMDYPDVARRLVDNGAEFLVAPSDNPLEWGPVQHTQHKQLFQMRAVECGRWLATTDVAGNTFLVAPTGRIVQSVTTTDPTVLDVTIGRLQERNLFVRGGWRFGQVCLTLLVAGFLWALWPRRTAV
jgi:apolipoprotein N-acyltransferase